MPLVSISLQQLEAAQQLYRAAARFINCWEKELWEKELEELPNEKYNALMELSFAVDHCKEEYEKHGG